MTAEDSARELLSQVFFPYAYMRTARVRARGARFAYYTSAEVATQILRKKEVWLRNAAVMNDFMEISHGRKCLDAAMQGPAGELLKSALDAPFAGLFDEVMAMFNSRWPTIERDTHMLCVSEHLAEEDLRGRLSMWRGYGGATGVALVLNGEVMFSPSNVLGVHSSPVFYGDAPAFATQFMAVASGLAAESALLTNIGRDAVREIILEVLRWAVLCTKHPGFQEELEWRAIANPRLHPSDRLILNVETVRGVPQIVAKIELLNAPQEGLVGLELPELLERIIIGPCDFPDVTYLAFVKLLIGAGVPDPETRIVMSDIPLRHRT
jgi:Protein of unknown function (DUF2971)